MRILFLSRWLPCPPANGSQQRVHALLRQLAAHHEVSLVSFTEPSDGDPSALRPLCRDVATVPWRPFRPRRLRAQLGFLAAAPRSIVDTTSAEMARCIGRAVAARSYDLVIASETTMASYAPRFAGLPALFEGVELGAVCDAVASAARPWPRARAGLTWWKHRRYLRQLLRHFQACTVVSERERQLLAHAAPGYEAVTIVPNCVDLARHPAPGAAPAADHLIFAGSFRYVANHDAMRWFVGEVLPRIRAARPGVRLTVTGDPAGRALPCGDGVVQTGFVDDVHPLVAAAWASVAPIRYGGGTRMKILESMALGTPVVATAKGAEGLDVRDGEHLLIADEPAAFAGAVLRLLGDAGLRSVLARNARRLVEERYAWQVVAPRFEDLVVAVARGAVPAAVARPAEAAAREAAR